MTRRGRRNRPPANNGREVQPAASNQGDQVEAVFRQVSAEVRFEGPVPPPALLQQYDQVVPGAAERILLMAEQQSAHRRHLENRVIGSDIHRQTAGLVCGFIVALAFLAAAVILVMNGHGFAGIFIGVVDIVALVSVFIYGTISRRRDLDARRISSR